MGDSEMFPESDHWCITTNGATMETTFSWTIKDFKDRQEKVDESLTSSVFSAKQPDGKDTNWQLELYPNGESDADTDPEYLAIYLLNKNKMTMRAGFRVSILNSDLKKKEKWKCSVESFSPASSRAGDWGNGKWLLRKDLFSHKELLPSGHLTIFCELTIYGKENKLAGSKHLEKNPMLNLRSIQGLEQAREHFGKLFNSKEFSDVEIECDGKIFNCHQLILSTRSDVFRAMFQPNTKESITKKVNIDDFDPDVVGEMLKFIYTGVANEKVLKEKTGELLAAAEKYQLDFLKNICEAILCLALKVTNSIEYLVLGDMHRAAKLRRMALKMVARNMTSLVTTDEYQDLVKNYPTIVLEIPAAMVTP